MNGRNKNCRTGFQIKFEIPYGSIDVQINLKVSAKNLFLLTTHPHPQFHELLDPAPDPVLDPVLDPAPAPVLEHDF